MKPNPITPESLAALKALWKRADEEWRVVTGDGEIFIFVEEFRIAEFCGEGTDVECDHDNAQLAVALHSAFPSILAALEADRWIPVGERLPEQKINEFGVKCYVSEKVLIYYDGKMTEAIYDADFKAWNYAATLQTVDYFVTHWRPLPAPPKDQS